MEGPAMAASNDMAQATQSGTATGTINAIDATAGKITIAHGPVESLGWPAMTMAFAATPEQIASVKQGEKVEFAFQSNSAGATVISIKPMQ
ncbi:copper-binding protein [Stenotrophomonas maltophilia]